MVKKTQTRFIILIMTCLLVAFAVIFMSISTVLNVTNNRNVISRLDEIKLYYDDAKTADTSSLNISKSIYGIVNLNKKIDDKFELDTLIFDEETFTRSQAIDTLSTITKESKGFGNIDNYYYRVYNQDTIVIADMSSLLISYSMSIKSIAIILVAIYLLLFVAVIPISFRVTQIIKDTLNKQLQFISNASHELKTPITVISANTDVLKNIDDNKWLDNISSQTQRMETLVNDMLTLAKIDEGNIPLTFENFNLSDEIISTVLPFDALSFEKGKHFTLDVPKNVTYHGDRHSVRKILNILIDNAIKYSSKDGDICLSLKTEPKLSINVFNTGSDIMPNETEKLFNRFYRGDNSRSRSTGGSGLGLAIAKGICDANKWKITAESKFHQSMSITIQL